MKAMKIMTAIFAMVMMVGTANATTNRETVSTAVETTTNSEYLVEIEHEDRVKANSTDIYTQKFYGGESVAILVEGDGDTDLDLFIYDENGNLIVSDTDEGDTCIAAFTPKWTGTFTIKIMNLGSVYNNYTLYVLQ